MLALFTPMGAQQNVHEILLEIERNNPALASAKADVEAERLSNRTEILLPGPEVEFNYLQGGNGLGNRHDLRVTQSFDFPSLSGMRKKQLAQLNTLSALRYAVKRQEVLLEAKQILIELAFQQQLADVLQARLDQARLLAEAFEKRFSAGDASLPDLAKAKMQYASVEGRLAQAQVERQALQDAIASLNGGIPLPFVSGMLFSDALPSDFEAWYAESADRNPLLAYFAQEQQTERQQLSIDRAAWVPDLTIGYMAEIGRDDRYRGLTSGIAIPLWSNASKIRATKAKIAASQSRALAARQQLHDQLLRQFNLAKGWKETADRLYAALELNDNRDLLLQAEMKGEISMVDYLYEAGMYYEVLEEALSADRAYRQALAELTAYEL